VVFEREIPRFKNDQLTRNHYIIIIINVSGKITKI